MKRERENIVETIESSCMDIAKCLMLLSQSMITTTTTKSNSILSSENIFECKTCNKKFSSFQALGGHRASHHKKPKLADYSEILKLPKMHECSICGLEFSMGQALGGHMRKHKAASAAMGGGFPTTTKVVVKPTTVVLKRVVCLDLNLTPLENGMEVFFGKKINNMASQYSFNLAN